MIYPHNILGTVPITNTAVDAESGRPTALAETPVYSGPGFFQSVTAAEIKRTTGDEHIVDGGKLFLPPGEHSIDVDAKIVVDDCYVGTVRMRNRFTTRFYTRYIVTRRKDSVG